MMVDLVWTLLDMSFWQELIEQEMCDGAQMTHDYE